MPIVVPFVPEVPPLDTGWVGIPRRAVGGDAPDVGLLRLCLGFRGRPDRL